MYMNENENNNEIKYIHAYIYVHIKNIMSWKHLINFSISFQIIVKLLYRHTD